MKAFHNDPSIKEALLKQLQAHYDADEIIKGRYWEDGKGCAIGCAIHSNDHSLYEERFNIPVWLAKVQDAIFEGLPNKKAKSWPILFTKSVNLGADLNKIKIPFLIFIVESVIDKFDHDKFPYVKNNIDKVLFHLKNHYNTAGEVSADFASSFDEAAAYSASAYAVAAYDYAAAAASAAAASSAAAISHANSHAAYSVTAAAAAYAHAASASAAAFVASYKAYEQFADKLIELIVNCKAEV